MATTTRSRYESRFADTLKAIQAALGQYLHQDEAVQAQDADVEGPGRLWEAMRYSALQAGKLLRPVLTVESGLALGGQMAQLLPTACAIEMVHAQSLIHDDLPCMDDDDLRRGKPTVHKAFDEATAVLTGDALLARAFGLVSRHTPVTDGLSAEGLLKVISRFSEVSSVQGLVNGQYVDIYYEDRTFDESVLRYIHTYKTGALFSFSAEAGARLAGCDDDVAERFARYGRTLGLAFQIVDDVLDVQSTSDALGKTVGKDLAQKKATYPALFGVETSQKKARQLADEARAILDGCPGLQNRDNLDFLTAYMIERIH